MVHESAAELDPLLEPLLAVPADDESALSELITTYLLPVIQTVVRYRLRFNIHRALERAEFEDIGQDALVQVLAEVRKFRRDSEGHPIFDVRGLAAVIAHRACARWMRRNFPARHAFKNRLHYLLSKHPDFALWPNEQRTMMAGLAAWRGKKKAVAAGSLTVDEALQSRILFLATSGRGVNSASIRATIFKRLGGPVEFDDLVGTLAGLIKISDESAEVADAPAETDVA